MKAVFEDEIGHLTKEELATIEKLVAKTIENSFYFIRVQWVEIEEDE